MRSALALLAGKLRGMAAHLPHVPRAVRLAASGGGRWNAAWIALLVGQGLLPAGIVALSRPLVDRVAAAVRSSSAADAYAALALAAAMAVLLLAAELARAASEWVRDAQRHRVESRVSALIQEKCGEVDLAFHEWPEYHDRLHRARAEAPHRSMALLESGGALLQGGVTLVAMAAVVLPYGAWISAALLASCLPALVVMVRFAIRQHRMRLRTTRDERRAAYYDWLLTAPETAAELRLFGFGAHFRSAYARLREGLWRERRELARSHAAAELGAAVVALTVAGACVAWMLWRTLTGEATLGELTLFWLAFSQGQRLMRALLGGIGQLYHHILFLGSLFDFLDLAPAVRDPAAPRALARDGAPGLRFRDVTFRYPGSERTALRNLELAVEPGALVAIVGANGAGKSTLLKLACRFYDADAGRIEVAGVDVRELRLAELRASIAMLFQDPVRYEATVAENIALPGTQASRAAIEAAADAAGAAQFIASLPRGYDTPLGRWVGDGVELSAGQWQRIALARAFLRPAPLLLLDEPTSAMDSWAEADWLERLRGLATGRTAIIVTHRFTTAMRADLIHVMEEGRIVESGSHAQLVARGAAYARSWHAQMRAASAANP